MGQSTKDAAERLRERLATLRAPILGVVANAHAERKSDGYNYTYYTGEGIARH
jgi:Mrp family chromosome partitioning ATPase